ncbi:hypothetical protein JTE90_015163 [Oedothorax gibbosus]|uniref:Uncharacterized protein n=1 Tax=Oedothorax gibbosus TaxID=931172 RepID=A0AAV6V749_9ARAC|nr:hypothetical protein JTE90_015163 [Oedothorax gibbosus]
MKRQGRQMKVMPSQKGIKKRLSFATKELFPITEKKHSQRHYLEVRSTNVLTAIVNSQISMKDMTAFNLFLRRSDTISSLHFLSLQILLKFAKVFESALLFFYSSVDMELEFCVDCELNKKNYHIVSV